MIFNKKGYSTKVFGFFLVLMLVSGVLFFLTVGMHYILHDYGIQVAADIAHDTIGDLNPSNSQLTAIDNLQDSYLNNVKYFDILFAVIILSMFIQSIISAIGAKRAGFLSFFGYVTLGNIFLIYLISFAVNIRGWFLNEIVYQILLVSLKTPFMTMFFNYSYYIGVSWFLILIAVNQLDLGGIKDKFGNIFNKETSTNSETQNPEFDLGGFDKK